jgi:hypothetical protein
MHTMTSDRITLRHVPAGWERDAFIQWLQRAAGAGIVVDMTDCPTGEPTHVIVKRRSGFVAGWLTGQTVEQAIEFARTCNDYYPEDVARVVAWDDTVWDAVLPPEGK